MSDKIVNGIPSKFVGGYLSLPQRQRFEALAAERGTSINGLLREIADRAVVAVVLPQKESSAGVDLPVTSTASR